ncbi:cytochrome P450 [Gigaspora rosea]|uniref:Cytochrome P450 n=1 Tax=Gigaspora rosea TaxID=44941 RepID=A0A397VRC3_9GLOM|nr:cytochrome P450 [Gigaspora rosea]
MLERRYIILSRPEYIEKFFDRRMFFLRPYSQGADEIGMYGYGTFFNNNYENWKHNNKFFTDTFISQKFIDNAIKTTNELYKELSNYWQSLGIQNSLNNSNDNWTLETDLSQWSTGFSNDIISIISTGERTYSIASYYNTQSLIKSEYPSALVENGDKFVKSIVKYLESLVLFAFFNPFIRHYIPIINNKSNIYLKNRDYLFENLDKIIMKRRKEIEKISVTETRIDMLSSLITANTNENGSNGEVLKPMSNKEIRGILLEVFLGGTATSANLFCFITYYICKNPHVKQKMLSEIEHVLPKSMDKSCISYNDLQKLRYCEAIIKEACRLIPAVPFTYRTITKEHEIAGYKWPPGTNFILNFLGVQVHPEFWPDPEVFNPDRFYNDDQNDKRLGDKSALMMFGGGKRICPGRIMAMAELLLLMVLVYENYNVELVNMHEPLKLSTQINTHCKELRVRISPRT